jgi:hypothetical protein
LGADLPNSAGPLPFSAFDPDATRKSSPKRARIGGIALPMVQKRHRSQTGSTEGKDRNTL